MDDESDTESNCTLLLVYLKGPETIATTIPAIAIVEDEMNLPDLLATSTVLSHVTRLDHQPDKHPPNPRNRTGIVMISNSSPRRAQSLAKLLISVDCGVWTVDACGGPRGSFSYLLPTT